MNQYITLENKPSEELFYVLDYLGISIDEFIKMSDEQIISIYKKSADALNDGVMTKSSFVKGGANRKVYQQKEIVNPSGWKEVNRQRKDEGHNDSGSKSRYFDVDVWAEKHGLLQFPKSSKRERNEGCEGLELREIYPQNNSIERKELNSTANKRTQNHHPTVKPVHLMSWLVKLISKEGDTVLDLFMGSGTTGVACRKLNRKFIGIELSEEYCEIAVKRIEGVETNLFDREAV